MRQKLSGLLSLSIFTLILIAGLASADIKFNPSSISQTITSGQTSVTVNFQLNHTGVGGNYTSLVWSGTSNVGSWSNLPNLTTLNTNEIISLNATLSSIPSNFIGTINANINVNNSGSPTENLPITIIVQAAPQPQSIPDEIKECNATGNLGNNLKIKIDDITVKEGYGQDEEWLPLDEVEIDIKVENRGDQDINNIAVGWGLYNKDTDEFYIDDEEKDFDLNKNDDKTITVIFRLDKNIDELDDNFVFYAWANAEDEEFNDDNTCESTSENIDLIIENDFVILDNIKFQETVQCSAELQITADVWNIGEDDQDDVSVYINNKELGIIDKKVEIGDINAFDDEKLDVTIKIPNNIQEKLYGIRLSVNDEDNDVYVGDYDDDESVHDIVVKVQGGCGEKEPKALVSAVLQSGGNAGEKLIIKSTITNTGEEKTIYTLNIAGYTEWANSADLDKKIITLNQGDSDSVLITFDVKDDASGDYNFDIEVLSGSNLIIKQPASVTIEKPTGISGITGRVIGGENWYLWAIGALNIILVIVIIIVAIRVARKK